MLTTKPRDPSKMQKKLLQDRRKRRFSPLMLIGISVTGLIALLGVGILVVRPLIGSHAAAAVNLNCSIIIPANPLSAQGLATPYQLTATNPADGPCNEANANQSAFVQAVILDPATGKMSAYEPLVIDKGTQPAIKPTAPQLPANAVVALWFGDNGNILKQVRSHARVNMAAAGNVAGANCVNGVGASLFGQFSYCNAVAFFQTANRLIAAGKITVPALGTAKDGKPCPSTRDFSIVDQDQSDNVQTQYLVTANGQTAQLSPANQAKLANATTIGNPSDNALVSRIVDPVIGCQAWQIPDLVSGNMTATLPTNELQAAAHQQAPVALIPAGDPMVLNNNQPDLTKVNAYRRGVDQTPAGSLAGASTTTYCQNLVKVALPRLTDEMAMLQNASSPDPAAANNLFTFLANRLNATFGAGNLNCTGLLKVQNPVTLTTDANGVVTAATITLKPVPA